MGTFSISNPQVTRVAQRVRKSRMSPFIPDFQRHALAIGGQ
jgi:hypothetical protein